MKRWLLGAAVVAMATAAQAEDKVKVGPTPAWVVKVDAPSAPPPKEEGLSARLADYQMRIDDAGLHQYSRQLFHLTTPAAVQAAGTATVAWQPEKGSATVHTLAIHRDGQVINVLGDGSHFKILQREAALEQAQINGIRTAVAPVPGLRVGDTLELGVTIDLADEALDGHVEANNMFLGGQKTERLHLRYSWPAKRAVKWRFGSAIPKPKKSDAAGFTTLTVDQSNYTSVKFPDATPGRFVDQGLVQISDFADWGAIARLMAPKYAQAATLAPDSPLAEEIARIAARSSDPMARATEALRLVQTDVRYFADLGGLGNYIPTAADAVWQARSGDCKGKTALLLALLHGLGIEAAPVLVSAQRSDGVDEALPAPGRFDHVIVRATIGGKTYWIDGTRTGDGAIDTIDTPPFKWGLVLRGDTSALTPIVWNGPTIPTHEWRLDLDARKGLDKPAQATGTAILRGDYAMQMRTFLSLVNSTQRDEFLRQLWAERHDWVSIDAVSQEIVATTGEVRLGFTGTATMDWDDDGALRYEADKSRLGRNLAPKRETGAPDFPVLIDAKHIMTHQTILLPDAGKGFSIEGESFDETIGGVQYKRTASLKDGRFDMTALDRSVPGELSLAAVKAADSQSDDIFAKTLFIRAPKNASEPAAAAPQSTEAQAIAEAGKLVTSGTPEKALLLLDPLIAQGKRTPDTLAARAGAQIALGRFQAAGQDLDAALATNPDHANANWMKAEFLVRTGRVEDAIYLMDRIILRDPQNGRAYEKRGGLRLALDQFDAAQSDFAIAVDRMPDDVEANIGLTRAYTRSRNLDQALAAADAFAKRLPNNPYAHALRANALVNLDRKKEALEAIKQSLALQPSADAYGVRLSMIDSYPDTSAIADDIVAAIAIEPTRNFDMAAMKRVAADQGAFQRLKLAYADAAKQYPTHKTHILGAAANLDAIAGDPAPLLAYLDGLVQEQPENMARRNNACWERANRNIGLNKALEDCTIAVTRTGNAMYLDSRGLVYLRKGDYALAIADYDAALTKMPGLAPSLLGRGIAKKRLGMIKEADADLAAARKIDADIEGRFADFGVSP